MHACTCVYTSRRVCMHTCVCVCSVGPCYRRLGWHGAGLFPGSVGVSLWVLARQGSNGPHGLEAPPRGRDFPMVSSPAGSLQLRGRGRAPDRVSFPHQSAGRWGHAAPLLHPASFPRGPWCVCGGSMPTKLTGLPAALLLGGHVSPFWPGGWLVQSVQGGPPF